MAKQTQTCYSIQRRLEMPSQLYFFDFTPYYQLYKTYLPGIDNWNIDKSDSINNNLQNAVYLTAEADELLDTVDKDWIRFYKIQNILLEIVTFLFESFKLLVIKVLS